MNFKLSRLLFFLFWTSLCITVLGQSDCKAQTSTEDTVAVIEQVIQLEDLQRFLKYYPWNDSLVEWQRYYKDGKCVFLVQNGIVNDQLKIRHRDKEVQIIKEEEIQKKYDIRVWLDFQSLKINKNRCQVLANTNVYSWPFPPYGGRKNFIPELDEEFFNKVFLKVRLKKSNGQWKVVKSKMELKPIGPLYPGQEKYRKAYLRRIRSGK